MNFYPYFDAPIIMTDTIYAGFGGDIDGTPVQMRKYAYIMAEEAVSRDIDSFLKLTIVTGTYLYASEIELEHAYVRRVILTRFKSFDEDTYYTVSGTANDFVALRDDTYGLVNVNHICHTHCGGVIPYPYQLQIVYEAGLVSGTSYNPYILMALAQYSTIQLNEMIGYGNESPGDIGVQEFSNQEYREKRVPLLNTAYGNSAKANYIHHLLGRFRKRKFVGMSLPSR